MHGSLHWLADCILLCVGIQDHSPAQLGATVISQALLMFRVNTSVSAGLLDSEKCFTHHSGTALCLLPITLPYYWYHAPKWYILLAEMSLYWRLFATELFQGHSSSCIISCTALNLLFS